MQSSQLDLDWKAASDEIVKFIRETVKSAGARGSVIGLSGAIDSSVVASILAKALGKDHVLGLLMPTYFTPKEDINDAKWLAKFLQIGSQLVDIQPMVDAFTRSLGAGEETERAKIPLANIRSRTRMIILYYFANLNNYLVAGTGDRSEDLIGYFTKYGDGGVDFLPISHLYKTQVRKLGEHLGLPSRIVSKPSSPQLYPGHRATDEIPMDYDRLDRVMRLLFDEKSPPEKVAEETKVPIEKIQEIQRRFQTSAHKRSYPLMVRQW
ncbi:MAG TPA: NAD+ synthase [Candidatus Angelobacter sp.]|nr:NAD+ synthase [Candidatus Angelobacter sp.]